MIQEQSEQKLRGRTLDLGRLTKTPKEVSCITIKYLNKRRMQAITKPTPHTCAMIVAINLTNIYLMGTFEVLLFLTKLYIFLMCLIVKHTRSI
jgi:hypothetical protein